MRPDISLSLLNLRTTSRQLSPNSATTAYQSLVSLVTSISFSGYNLSEADLINEKLKTLTYHRIDEAFRFAYAKRSYLGDDENNPNITRVSEVTSKLYS